MENKSKKPKAPTRKHVARLEKERKQARLVWTIALVMFGVIIILLGYGYLDTTYLQLQRPVATVNGEEITIEHWQGVKLTVRLRASGRLLASTFSPAGAELSSAS